MVVSHLFAPQTALPPIISLRKRERYPSPRYNLNIIKINTLRESSSRRDFRVVQALNEVNIADPTQAEITWQILIGALAGVTPFVVAGVEFSKRIVAQQQCPTCKGSGLVLRDKKYYFRCPKCGGFLPWQSWKRFFSG